MRPWLSHSDFGMVPGITTNDILKAADYSLGTVFRKFFFCPVNDPSFGSSWSVLASGNPWHVQLHPSKHSASYKQHHWYMRLSFLKYNFQMAQTMQSLHAILNSMKKVHINGPTHPSQQQKLAFKRFRCDHVVGYLQGSFYACVCCFWCTLHVYRPLSCRCLE